MGHTFQLDGADLDRTENLIEDIEEWLQLNHGPFFDYKKYYVSSATDTVEYKTLYDLLDQVPSYATAVYVGETVTYKGKKWSFENLGVNCYVNKGPSSKDKIFTATVHRRLTIHIDDDTMAVDFKLRFM
jgi:hypothetical protein